MRHFTEAENIAWMNSLPSVRTASEIMIFDPGGELLLVQPAYKPGLTLVGGGVETGESPLAAAVREAKEEVSLDLTNRLHLVGLHYYPPNNGRLDSIQFFFRSSITQAEAAAIKLHSGELENSSWHRADSLPDNVRGSVTIAVNLLTDESLHGYSEGLPPGVEDKT